MSLALVLAVATAGRAAWARRLVSAAELVSVSVPPFVIGIVLLFVFSFTLGWFPVTGAEDPAALVLPATALGLSIAGVLGQVLREGLERALEQPFAVSARARALWSRQRGMVFTVANLPPLPAGRVYQVWVVTAQAPVSAGLLTPDAAGGGSVYFETPVDILPPTAVAVTLEPAGGVPAPTGAMYLVGTPSPL